MPNPTSNQIESNIIEDIIKDKRNLFRSKRKNNAVKDKIIIDIRTLFEMEEGDYCEPV